MNLTEKASYIKGLVDGMELDTTTKEGKVISLLLDLVGELAGAVCDLDDDVQQIYDEIDAIDEDLTDVENFVFDEDDEECDGNCDECEGCDSEDDVYEITCPNCGKVSYVDGETLDGDDLHCPRCGVKWEAEFEDEDEEDENGADGE